MEKFTSAGFKILEELELDKQYGVLLVEQKVELRPDKVATRYSVFDTHTDSEVSYVEDKDDAKRDFNKWIKGYSYQTMNVGTGEYMPSHFVQ